MTPQYAKCNGQVFTLPYLSTVLLYRKLLSTQL